MKSLIIVVTTLLLAFSGNYFEGKSIIVKRTPCPPYHEDASKMLEEFLTDEELADKRQEIGITNIPMQEVDYLKNKTVCGELQKVYEWPLEDHHRVYFKSDDYYFVVDKLKTTQQTEEGKIHIQTGYSSIVVLNKEFERVGRLSF